MGTVYCHVPEMRDRYEDDKFPKKIQTMFGYFDFNGKETEWDATNTSWFKRGILLNAMTGWVKKDGQGDWHFFDECGWTSVRLFTETCRGLYEVEKELLERLGKDGFKKYKKQQKRKVEKYFDPVVWDGILDEWHVLVEMADFARERLEAEKNSGGKKGSSEKNEC